MSIYYLTTTKKRGCRLHDKVSLFYVDIGLKANQMVIYTLIKFLGVASTDRLTHMQVLRKVSSVIQGSSMVL